MKIIKILLAIFLLSGCESEDEKLSEKIKGSWECIGSLPPSAMIPNGEIKGSTQYMPGGKSSTHATLTAQDQGITLNIELLMSGTWKIEERSLIETVTHSSLMGMTANGSIILASELPSSERIEMNRIINAFVGNSTLSEIRHVSESKLDLYLPTERTNIRCDRM